MQLRVDPDVCQGHARCVVYAPGLIELDGDGRARVVVGELSPEHWDAARLAEQACPERALIIEEGSS